MKSRRKKRLINTAVQGALARRTTLHWLMFLALLVVVLPLWRLISGGDFIAPFSVLIRASWAESAPVLLVLIALLPIFVWDTVSVSHRFAGPIYRFHKAIKDMVDGNEVQPIRLRDGDAWAELADDFNSMLERLDLHSDKKTATTDQDESLDEAGGSDVAGANGLQCARLG